MIVSIDQSPKWRGCRIRPRDWTRLMEVLFRRYPDRRPASGLEVLMLSLALGCPEAPIERQRTGTHFRLVPKRYNSNMPA
jgi:hypothetical protein